MKTLIIYISDGDEVINNKYDIMIGGENDINKLYRKCPKKYNYYLFVNRRFEFDINMIVNELEEYKPAIYVLNNTVKIYHRSVIHYSYPLLDENKYGSDIYVVQNIVEEVLDRYTIFDDDIVLNKNIGNNHLRKWFEKCIYKRCDIDDDCDNYEVIDEDLDKINFMNTFDIFKYFDVEHDYFQMKRIKFHKNNREMHGYCGMYNFRHDFHNINRNSIINHLIEKFNYKTYLEIGVYNCAHFNDVKIKNKYGVDPFPKLDDPTYQDWADKIYKYPSLEFFKILDESEKFDIIFIDGCLYEYNVMTDVMNSLEHLSENGTIVLHDCNPPNEFLQRDNYNAKYNGSQGDNVIWNNRTYTGRNWNGKAWSVITTLRTTRSDLEVYTVNSDWGTAIIRRGEQELLKIDEDVNDYNTLVKYRKYMLNLISPEKFLEIFS